VLAFRRCSVVRPVLSLVLLLLGMGCHDGPEGPTPPGPDDELRRRFDLRPLGEAPYPADNGPSAARIDLGRFLFFDPILSGEKDVACGTCHHPSLAFADGRQFGAGVSGVGLGPTRILSVSAISGLPIDLGPRNTPTVLNAAFNADESGAASPLGFQFWDGRARGLEEQARGPIASRGEMAGDAYPLEEARDSVVARLRSIAEYVRLFRGAFPTEAAIHPGAEVISMDTYGRAVAAYERELVTRFSPYDRYALGENAALTPSQKRGLELFFTKAGCNSCHAGPMFSDFRFHVVGVPQEGSGTVLLPGDDVGREESTGDPADRYAFRTATLRNVALTAPYMHDGAFATLNAVVRFYNDGARPRHAAMDDAVLDPLVRQPLDLTDGEVADLVGFLEALTDPGTGLDPLLLTIPEAVPSGLTPVFGVRSPGVSR